MTIALRVLTAVALVGVAVVHLRIADGYTAIGTHPLAIGDQFYVQAALAFLLAAAVLVRPAALVWAACALFAIGSLAVLVYSRYRPLPVYGFAGGFQESWEVEGAKLAAAFESAAVVLSLLGGALAVGGRASAR
ncbi:MAG: hypothetical protein ABR549_06060 [Mycobacteriales bacterium]